MIEQVVDYYLFKLYFLMIEVVMVEMGVNVVQMIMIGDISFDMFMVCVVGVCGIGVSWGYYGCEKLVDVEIIIDWFEDFFLVLD